MAVVHKAIASEMPMAVARAAIVFCVAVAPPVVFQFLLALGAPWGALTMGGINPGQLPPAMRLNAVLSALILCGTALVVCVRAGLENDGPLATHTHTHTHGVNVENTHHVLSSSSLMWFCLPQSKHLRIGSLKSAKRQCYRQVACEARGISPPTSI